MKARILNSSVSLKGANPKGSDFDGSAAMLCISQVDGSTLLVSAKHNLEVYWEGGTRPPLNDIVDSFRENVKIYYEGNMQFNTVPAQVAAINEVIPVTTVGAGDWDYDVMILKSSDQRLSQVCSANQIYPVSNIQQKLSYDQVATTEKFYLSKTQPKNIQAYFVQTGFGKVRDTSRSTSLPTGTPGPNRKGGLQYRDTSPRRRRPSRSTTRRGRPVITSRMSRPSSWTPTRTVLRPRATRAARSTSLTTTRVLGPGGSS